MMFKLCVAGYEITLAFGRCPCVEMYEAAEAEATEKP